MSKITVREIMKTNVLTVAEDIAIEEAARIMADNKVGGLPVMRGDRMVGIITETDLFKIFLEMMGARQKGIRVSALMRNKPGEIAKLGQTVFGLGGNIIAMGTSAGVDPSNAAVTFKVVGVDQEELRVTLEPLVERLMDIRVC
jgi:acetoin utilization protein AcuB